MKFLVVGTGSIGSRHIANLKRLKQYVVAYSYRNTGAKVLDCKTPLVSDLDEALNAADVVVIANQTHKHMELALKAAQLGKHLYIEKPLSHKLQGAQQLLDIVAQKQLKVCCGFMLRHHPNLLWIKQAIADNTIGKIYAARFIVGQWLPDWRPQSDYSQSYSAFYRRGGGVVFDLIHELDIAYWLLGCVDKVQAFTAKNTALAIETESVAQISLAFESGILAQLHLDYLRPNYQRKLEIIGAKGIIYWDYAKQQVWLEQRQQQPQLVQQLDQDFDRNQMFLDAMKNFIAAITEQKPINSPLTDAVAVLKLALSAHQSATKQKIIQPQELMEK